jgi:hypothetical protein
VVDSWSCILLLVIIAERHYVNWFCREWQREFYLGGWFIVHGSPAPAKGYAAGAVVGRFIAPFLFFTDLF